jgi:hypothetical protein
VWVELFNTRTFRHPRTGKVYLLAASDAIHIYEVLGTDEALRRFDGEFDLTAAGLQAAKDEWQRRQAPNERLLTLRRTLTPVVVDGDTSEFAQAPAAALPLSPTASGSARLLYDDAFLYVAVDVQDDSPWKNAGGDNTALFTTGDTISLWAGLDAAGQPALGDVQLLFAPDPTGGVRVVESRAKVSSGAQPVTYTSPSGSVTLQKVAVVTSVAAAVRMTAGGYRLEAAIPRALVGLEPATERFGLDLSVNFSDPAGQRNVACLRWGRNGAINVYDLPSQAQFEPDTWGAGVLGSALPSPGDPRGTVTNVE